MSNLKVEGKVADFCPKCKNCKSTTRECDGEKDWLTEVECEDPYDGMIKTLDADSDICCSMFAPKPDRACAKCERFDGTYCHGPNGTITISYKALFGEPVNCPSFEEKKESCETETARETKLEDKVSAYEKILNDILDTVYEHPETFERNMTAYELLPGRVKFLKDSWDMMCDKYDPLNVENEQRKKAMDNQAKMISDLKKERDDLILNYHKKFKEKDNKINFLSDCYRTDEKLIDNIQRVIFPQEEGSDFTYGYDEILNKVKELKEELEKLRNADISKVPICKEILSTISELKDRNEELEKKINTKNKDIDILLEDNKRMNERNSELYQVSLNKSRDIIDLGKKLKKQECLNDINADIISRLMLENQRLLTRNRKLQVKLNDVLPNPESNRLEEEDK